MARKILFIILLLILAILLSWFAFEYLYLRPVKAEAKIEFDKDKKEIIISFKYPIFKDYFLKNFQTIPNFEGKYIFENYKYPIFLKMVRFVPEKIERDKNYKIKTFEKEFSFSLPSPKPREIIFNEEKKEFEISFFEPIEEDYFFEKLKFSQYDGENYEIIPRGSGEYTFSDLNTKIIFKPAKIEEDKDYRVEILGKELSYKIESPKVKDIYFDEENNEAVITFTKKIEESRFFENFKFYECASQNCLFISQDDGESVFDESSDKVVFKPSKIEAGKDYKIEVMGKTLEIEGPEPPKPEVETQPQSQPQPQPKPKPEPKPEPQFVSQEKMIEIDLSVQKLKLHKNGEVIAEYTISSGKSGMRTPTGDFRVLSKEENHWSSTYALWMPYSLRFHNGFYIHELPYWPGGYREGEEHLGIPVSHGCVRLGIGAAEVVYGFVEVGTQVEIHQ